MRLARRGFLALLWLCGTVTGSASASDAPQSQVFPLSIVDNRPFIAVQVDGKGPFSFIVDTGSSSSTVSTALAAKLKLAPTSAGTGTGAGEQQLSFKIVHLNDLSVGPFSVGALDIPAMDTTPAQSCHRISAFRRRAWDGDIPEIHFNVRCRPRAGDHPGCRIDSGRRRMRYRSPFRWTRTTCPL